MILQQRVHEPVVENIEEVCGLYFRSVLLAKAFTALPQHEHDHSHATYVGSGSVRVWVDNKFLGDFVAGRAIPIEAGKKHFFQSIEDNTRLACVHDVASAMAVKERGL